MNRFVVAVDGSGRLHPDVTAFLDAPDVDLLPFGPERHARWSDSTGTVHYAGWERGPEPGSEVSPSGCTAWAGMPRPRCGLWPPGRPIVDLVRETIDDPGWSAGASLCDAYAVVRLRSDGSGVIASDPIGVHPLYRAGHGSLTVLGNRADLVAEVAARAAGRPPARDLVGAAWMAHLGFHLTGVTGFEGVEVVPHDVHLELQGRTVRFVPSTSVLDVDPDATAPQIGDLASAVTDSVADALRHAIGRSAHPPHVELTGGKDSRLIMAVALRAGLTDRLRFVTFGPAEAPDMVVARAIAERFDLDHLDTTDQQYGAAAAFTTSDRYRRHVRRSCGASPCTDANEPVPGLEPVVSGHLGELFRTARARLVAMPPADADAAAAGLMRDRAAGDPGLVHPARARPLREAMSALLAEIAERIPRPVDLTHAFNVRCRYPGWQGPLVDHHERRVLPLFAPHVLRSVFAAGSARDAEALHHRVIHDASPDLAAMPFANDSWRGEDMAVVEPVRGAATVRHIRRAENDHQEVLREILAERPDNPAFEMIDRAAVAAGIDRLADLRSLERMQLLGAIAALIWHGDLAASSRPE